MRGCPVCENQKIVDPKFLEEAKVAAADLMAELIVFAHNKKVDYRTLPAFTKMATFVRIIESL